MYICAEMYELFLFCLSLQNNLDAYNKIINKAIAIKIDTLEVSKTGETI